MNDIRGFLRWQFSGTLRSPSFWGFAITILANIAMVGGCPAPIPLVLLITGLAIVFADATRWIIRLQYRLYQHERDNIMRELERK